MTENHPTRLANALLDAQREHCNVKLYSSQGAEPTNAVVLGFDYYENALLLDGLSQQLHGRLIKDLSQQSFWLQLRHRGGFVRLHCKYESFQFDLLTVKVLDHIFTDNQRWQPRIHFDSRHGPQITCTLKNSLPFEGHIKNLSPHGALVEVFGLDLRERFARQTQFECALRFNELFEIPLNCVLKQFRFKRQPSCHSSMRLKFRHQSAIAVNQIENFIEAFDVHPHEHLQIKMG